MTTLNYTGAGPHSLKREDDDEGCEHVYGIRIANTAAPVTALSSEDRYMLFSGGQTVSGPPVITALRRHESVAASSVASTALRLSVADEQRA